jgi:hypothetical protein
MRTALAVIIGMLLSGPTLALAADRTLVSTAGNPRIVVWQSDTAMSDGLRLLDAKADMKLVTPLVSCAPATGTRFVVSDGGFSRSGIIILNGPFAGCRGVVSNQNMGK